MTRDHAKTVRRWLTPAEHATYRWLEYASAFNWAVQTRRSLEELALSRRDGYITAKALRERSGNPAPHEHRALLRSMHAALAVKQARHWTHEKALRMAALRQEIINMETKGDRK